MPENYVNERMIMQMQDNLPTIRNCLGWSQLDLAKKLDVTRQTIIRIEASKDKRAINKTQYIAIRTLVMNEIERRPEEEKEYLTGIISSLLGDFADSEDEEIRKNSEVATLAGGALASGLAIGVVVAGAVVAAAVKYLANRRLQQDAWLERLDTPRDMDDDTDKQRV